MLTVPTTEVGWYNGDPVESNVVAQQSYEDDPLRTYVFDRFKVPFPGWTVQGLFSRVWVNGPVFDAAMWEIRRGMDEGQGGTVVRHGRSRVRLTPSGKATVWGVGYKVEINNLDLHLMPGTYWLALVPVYPAKSPHGSVRLGVSEADLINDIDECSIYVDPVGWVRIEFSGSHFDKIGKFITYKGFRGFPQGVVISRRQWRF